MGLVTRTHLKNIFWPKLFVGASFQILDIQQYASGLKLGPAAILNQNLIFDTGSRLMRLRRCNFLMNAKHTFINAHSTIDRLEIG